MARIPVLTTDFVEGEPLPWAVYDENGRMLLQRGAKISALQFEILHKRGLYRDPDADKRGGYRGRKVADTMPPFERLDALIKRVSLVFDAVHAATPGVDLGERVLRLVDELQELYDDHSDAMLGAVHLAHKHDYTVGHPTHCAILCEMMARSLEYDIKRRQSLLAAAFTQNVAMLNLQETLQKQSKPLSQQQREVLTLHPERAVALLRKGGVKDEVWLTTVAQHHERISGDGYPAGLRGEGAISETARILAMADRYAALVSSRAYRRALPARESLKQLYLGQESDWGVKLTQRFIHEMGVYPPGSFVVLVNGEIGVVTHRGNEALRPVVSSFLAPTGAPFPRPFRRDTLMGEFRIRSGYVPKASETVNPNLLWAA
ncbi:hypothetical protein CAI21_18395 [Alkalilimnicola ehrlichii]|uniref:HD-GYP domain-containing protein n=1 Tax=Alkalilimnicola ehrlichii TaxID=351052 RepID=A0A3E0WIL9_9GAMM|nr:HD domain-containing phosphohydrolase [Alkalilimnicola ehrlichii]RFA25739.1 hypothetical protein CAI21_18395 [Alkalilimnicola ehrlichii]RFA32822.1 hypothetical protein CAL65_18645 [Alkalilimnicola ehrlichii]